MFEGFLHLSPPSFFDEFPGRCLEIFPSEFVVFSFRAKTADKRNLQYLPSENQYSPRCALAPAPRLRRRRRQKTHAKTTSRNREKSSLFLLFACRQALPQRSSQNDLPEALRDPPGDPLGASGDTLGGPRRPQEAPRATQEGPRSRPGPPRSGPKRPQKPASAPVGLRGAILEPFWLHFGASGGRFPSLRRLIFERPGGIF